MRNLLPQNAIEDVVYIACFVSLLAVLVGSGFGVGVAFGLWLAAAYVVFSEGLR